MSAVVLPSLFEEQVAGPAGEPVPPEGPGRPEAAHAYLALLEECVRAVDVPVLASLNGTSRHGWTSFARQLQDTDAAAVECCFYAVPQHVQHPARDVEGLTVRPRIELSQRSGARLPQTWIALLREQLTVSLAGTGSVEIVDAWSPTSLPGRTS